MLLSVLLCGCGTAIIGEQVLIVLWFCIHEQHAEYCGICLCRVWPADVTMHEHSSSYMLHWLWPCGESVLAEHLACSGWTQ